MSINETKDFIFENQYKSIRFSKDSSQSMILKTLYLKTFFEEKRFVVACKQINRRNT